VTFAEQVEGLTGRYLRRSLPLPGLLGPVGLALAGRAGARLAAALGIVVHRTTLLGLVAALPESQVSAAPQILGVDDFLWTRRPNTGAPSTGARPDRGRRTPPSSRAGISRTVASAERG
jgi:hypothetical protein